MERTHEISKPRNTQMTLPRKSTWRTRTSRLVLLFALALLVTATAATPADAAKRKVPFGFFGTLVPPEMMGMSDATLDQQMALMASSGVESVRVTVTWSQLEPSKGAYSFGLLDRLVAAAARHRIAVLVTVTEPTRWNSQRPNDPEWFRFPTTDPAAYAELMRQLVLRYGPAGSLWAQNPTLNRVPVRQWQIWNEQTAPWHWRQRPWAPSYTRLLKAAYRAIHQTDRGAKVVAGSLVAPRANYAPWHAIRDLYRAGAKRFFDVVAIHPFTHNPSVRGTVTQTLEFARRVRSQMRRRRDGRKPIIFTEMTWPAAVGSVPRRDLLGFETTPRGQRQRVKAVYGRLVRERRKLRITQAYYYTWATQYDRNASRSVVSFRFSGLVRMRDGAFSPMPVLRTYASVAARYEGCRKSTDARRCR
jgi:polysaccharide biosynthesis protein PslG